MEKVVLTAVSCYHVMIIRIIFVAYQTSQIIVATDKLLIQIINYQKQLIGSK